MRQWKLSKPDIVVSVHGGLKNFQLDPRHKEIFNRGLIKAAKTTNSGAWIITGKQVYWFKFIMGFSVEKELVQLALSWDVRVGHGIYTSLVSLFTMLSATITAMSFTNFCKVLTL